MKKGREAGNLVLDHKAKIFTFVKDKIFKDIFVKILFWYCENQLSMSSNLTVFMLEAP